jgi:hypothetical protein
MIEKLPTVATFGDFEDKELRDKINLLISDNNDLRERLERLEGPWCKDPKCPDHERLPGVHYHSKFPDPSVSAPVDTLINK